jgi:hypothetical protein
VFDRFFSPGSLFATLASHRLRLRQQTVVRSSPPPTSLAASWLGHIVDRFVALSSPRQITTPTSWTPLRTDVVPLLQPLATSSARIDALTATLESVAHQSTSANLTPSVIAAVKAMTEAMKALPAGIWPVAASDSSPTAWATFTTHRAQCSTRLSRFLFLLDGLPVDYVLLVPLLSTLPPAHLVGCSASYTRAVSQVLLRAIAQVHTLASSTSASPPTVTNVLTAFQQLQHLFRADGLGLPSDVSAVALHELVPW